MACLECKKKKRTEEEKKDLIVRLNRVNGQINGIKKMVEEDRYCNDILIQLAAVNNAVKSIANKVLDSHMHTCLIENIENKEYGIIDELIDLMKRFQ